MSLLISTDVLLSPSLLETAAVVSISPVPAYAGPYPGVEVSSQNHILGGFQLWSHSYPPVADPAENYNYVADESTTIAAREEGGSGIRTPFLYPQRMKPH